MWNKHKYLIFSFSLTLLLIGVLYYPVVLHPNDYLFAPDGDGIKNYYTYMYHLSYESDFWDFGGMNYPFGEHITYTDAHPLLSWLLGALELENYAIGILNFLMLLSFPIGAFFLYKIFRYYSVSEWWSSLFAVAIILISPQVFRMTGHFSLSYAFAIPMTWWFLLKVNERPHILWSSLFVLTMLAFFFTHPYLSIIMLFMMLSFWGVKVILSIRDIKRSLRYVLQIFTHVGLPIIIFQLLVGATDTHAERSNDPAGFYHYYGSWKTVLLPHSGPINSLLNLLKVRIGPWEAFSYLGFTTIVFSFFTGFYLVQNRKELGLKRLLKSDAFILLTGAWLVLLFSFCFPFKFDSFKWIVEMFGPLKQFRVLGRFSWIFFFVVSVLSVVAVYRISLRPKSKMGIKYLLAVGLIFYFVEGIPAHYRVSSVVHLTPNEFKKEEIKPDLVQVVDYFQKEKYDAIIFLPFAHFSSENIMILGEEESNHDAFLLSFHTQTPLINSVSSRMSMKEATVVNNFFGPEYTDKEFCELLKGKRIGIVKNSIGLSADELRLIWVSNEIFHNDEYAVFEYENDSWNNRKFFDYVLNKKKLATESKEGWMLEDTKLPFVYEGYDDQNPKGPMLGEGAFEDQKNGYNILYDLPCQDLPDSNFIVRFWYDSKLARCDVSAVVEEIYNDGAEPQWVSTAAVSESNLIVDGWCRIELRFTNKPELDTARIMLQGNDKGEFFRVDELLIYPEGAHLFKEVELNGQTFIVYNNDLLRKDSFAK